MEQNITIGPSRTYIKSFVSDCLAIRLALIVLLLAGCSQGPSPIPTNNPVSTKTPGKLTETLSQPTQTPTPPDRQVPTALPTLENDVREACTPAVIGTVSGTMTQGGKFVPNGVVVVAVFDGGPLENAEVQNGRYSLPLLARQCPDGLHWVGFQLRVGHQDRYLVPDNAELHHDVDLPPTAETIILSSSACGLTVGSVTGQVLVDGIPAPDGTPILAARVGKGTAYPYGDPNKDFITQKASTLGGRYSLISVGVRCENGEMSFSPMTLFAPGISIPITPTQENMAQNIVVP